MRTRLAAVLLFLFVLYGCLGFSRDYTSYYTNNMSRIAVSDPSYYEECQVGGCVCMVCQNGTSDIPFFGFFSSLVGGNCHFEQECKQTRVDELNTAAARGSGVEIRQFMLGQGPSFADFGDANPYCKNRLTMAVQWLTGAKDTPYSLPDPARAICLLDKGVMPVYVLYSDRENIDSDRAGEIAHVLGTEGDAFTLGRLTSGPVGPVVVTTEINYDASDAAVIAEQVREINTGCDNNRAGNEIHCLVAVAPKMGDTAALDAVLSQAGIADQVDLVAYGVDSRYARSCVGAEILEYEVIPFSQYSLYTWGKPTVIPYVMFDSAGTNAEGSCRWTRDTARAAYAAFFPFGVTRLPQTGVIGVAPYSFNSTSYGSVGNPLNCVDCAVARDTARLNAWYGGCQEFTDLTKLSAGGGVDEYADARGQLVFPNASAGFCDSSLQWATVFRSFSFAGGDFGTPQVAAAGEPEDISLRCDACLTWTMNRSPFAFEVPSLAADALHSACYNMSPEIDYWANQRNVDPMLMRSLIWVETGGTFDPCAAAKSCRGDYHGAGCFAGRTEAGGASEGYGTGLNEIYDPSGTCDPAKLENDPDTPPSTTPQWRWSGLGLTQSLEPPYDFWPAEFRADGVDGPYYYVLKNATDHGRSPVLEFARACNPTNFNPFNATDSICIGAIKTEDYLSKAQEWINRNRPLLNWNSDDFEKENAFRGYVAMNMYAGFWSNTHLSSNPACVGMQLGICWATQFHASSIVTPEYCTPPEGESTPPECSGRGTPDASRCYGYTDFVKYVRECELQYLPETRRTDPGSTKMGYYYYLRDNCDNSYCPDWKQIYKSDPAYRASHPLPSSGSIYIPD